MRISLTYFYVINHHGYPHSVSDALKSLPKMGALGFRFAELEGLGKENLRELYRRRKEACRILDGCGVHIHNFCVVDPDLVAPDLKRRQRALDRFQMGVELVELFGTETLHLASYAPPVKYQQLAPYNLTGKGSYRFEDVTRLQVPEGFHWDAVWKALVESVRACADAAAQAKRTILMEPRIGETICTVDSLLRLMEHVDRPNLAANFDTGHFSAARENVALAVAKLEGKFANVHVSDNHPSNSKHLPIGEGSIDWKEFLRMLRRVGFDGYLGLDFGGPDKAYRRSVERLQETAASLGFSLEV